MTIEKLNPADLDRAAEALTSAFDADPIYGSVFPSAADRARFLPGFWRSVVQTALRHSEVYAAGRVDGVACWLPPGHADISFRDGLATGFALQRAVGRFPGPARSMFLKFVNFVDSIHKQQMGDRPHWYLWVLGVTSGRQGQGLGGRLLAPVLARADAEGLPCYLETESERNVAFYTRHGFEVVQEGAIPGEPVPLWMMARRPR
jgi:ribosomal protein S18 acetylase RimI-like enzyme